MNDLVKRLRENPVAYAETAAKELERLRAERDALVAGTSGAEMAAQDLSGQLERLRAECLRLSHAEAEAMSVVLSLEGQVEKLRAEVVSTNGAIQHYVARVNQERERTEKAEAESDRLRELLREAREGVELIGCSEEGWDQTIAFRERLLEKIDATLKERP